MNMPKPLKLGHLVLRVKDLENSIAFYQDIVGLSVSDRVGKRMAFMRAGADHHDLALVQMSDTDIANSNSMFTNVEHFAYQVSDYSAIEAATKILQENSIEITRGPGKHGSGENCFIVFKDPDGNNIEFYSDMRQITPDKPYTPTVWNDDIDTFDQWRCEKFVVEPPAPIKAKLAAKLAENS
jgi:catechol-2,3-dioxygenase